MLCYKCERWWKDYKKLYVVIHEISVLQPINIDREIHQNKNFNSISF